MNKYGWQLKLQIAKTTPYVLYSYYASKALPYTVNHD